MVAQTPMMTLHTMTNTNNNHRLPYFFYFLNILKGSIWSLDYLWDEAAKQKPIPRSVVQFSPIVLQRNILTFSCCCTSFVAASFNILLLWPPLTVHDRFYVPALQPCPAQPSDGRCYIPPLLSPTANRQNVGDNVCACVCSKISFMEFNNTFRKQVVS